MIKLFNIDLTNTTIKDQYKKLEEEICEFTDASNKALTQEEEREHAIEEFWDMVQAGLGVLKKVGINHYEVEEGYIDHYKKMEARGFKPRKKH